MGDPYLDEEGVAELREIIVASGALARTEERITRLTDTALAALRRVALADSAADMLIDLALAATRRSV